MSRAGTPASLRLGVQRLAVVTGLAVALVGIGCTQPREGAPTGASSPTTVTGSTTTTPPPRAATWQMMPAAPLPSNYQQTGVWDGAEFLIAERVARPQGFCRDVAAAFRPADNAWRDLPPPPGPKGCYEGGDRAVWTGHEMLLWGVTNTAYDPETNRWRHLPVDLAGSGGPAVVVWTGHQMIGWGGGCCGEASAEGTAYTPATDSWRRLPPSPLEGRPTAAGAWTGTEMIVAGGTTGITGEFQVFADAAGYNPKTRAWRMLPPMPTPRTQATAVWDGTELLIIGGHTIVGNRVKYLARGVAYNPSTDRWRWLPPMAFPREGFVAEWTDNEVLVWGGRSRLNQTWLIPPHGEAYDPVKNAWTALPRSPLRGRVAPAAVWTGTSMLIWGGFTEGRDFADGAAFSPGTA